MVLGLSQRQVARSVRLGQSTVWDHLVRFRVSGLSWEQVEALDDEALEQRLFPSEQVLTERSRAVPDWSQIHQELKHKEVTLQLLWHEYNEVHPEGRRTPSDLAWARGRLCRQDRRDGQRLRLRGLHRRRLR